MREPLSRAPDILTSCSADSRRDGCLASLPLTTRPSPLARSTFGDCVLGPPTGSPAIDAGHNATCAAPLVNNQSRNGVVRPQDGDGNGVAVCDIGSYEAPALTLPAAIFTAHTDAGSCTAVDRPDEEPGPSPSATKQHNFAG